MAKTQKLELTWIGKENRPRLEPRILLETPEYSCNAPHRVSDSDIIDKVLIHGDNLLVIKALVGDPVVQAKREAAEAWCAQATAYSVAHGGKAWRYRVLAGNGITENMGLEGLVG